MNRILPTLVRRSAFALACLAGAAHAGDLPALAGRWLTANGNLEVDFHPCGDAWCGKVVRELGNQSMSRPGETMDAVDAAPMTGRTLVRDLRPGACDSVDDITYSLPTDCGVWYGSLYNRENGRTYDATLQVDGEGRLVVRPYVGLPIIGRTLLWTRAEGSLPPTAAGSTGPAHTAQAGQ